MRVHSYQLPYNFSKCHGDTFEPLIIKDESSNARYDRMYDNVQYAYVILPHVDN